MTSNGIRRTTFQAQHTITLDFCVKLSFWFTSEVGETHSCTHRGSRQEEKAASV